MSAPLSNDLRKRIVEARLAGDTVAKIAKEKGVSESAVNDLMALYRETGSYKPRPLNNGRKPRLTAEQLEAVKQRIMEQPDVTLRELIEELLLPLSQAALSVIINKKLKLRRKKNTKSGGARTGRCEETAGRLEDLSRNRGPTETGFS